MEQLNCKNCDREFKVFSYRAATALYCSRDCKADYLKKNSGAIRNCSTCGKQFYARGNRKGRVYCSKACYGKFRKRGKVVTCDYCKKEIYKPNCEIERSEHLFCGIECANKFQKCQLVEIECRVCHKKFEVYPSSIKVAKSRGHEVKYCSLGCRNVGQRELLAKLNERQNRNKKPNKLETTGNEILNSMGILFEPQCLINNKFTVDVFIPLCNTVIEWWGSYWHGHPTKIAHSGPDVRQKQRMLLDVSQRKYLETCGYKVLSFWDYQVYNNPISVGNEILKVICGTE